MPILPSMAQRERWYKFFSVYSKKSFPYCSDVRGKKIKEENSKKCRW